MNFRERVSSLECVYGWNEAISLYELCYYFVTLSEGLVGLIASSFGRLMKKIGSRYQCSKYITKYF